MANVTRFLVLFIGVMSFVFVSDASATVGGPTYIERLFYSPNENALYYLVNDQGGRGCFPEVEKLILADNKRIMVLSCNQIEELYYTKDGFNQPGYDQFIENTFKQLIGLTQFNLSKNNISVVVDYLGEQKDVEGYTTSSDFRAKIFQSDRVRSMVDFVGCYKDQPNVFRGYLIPNTSKIAIVVSRIGDCFEGGYVKEDLYMLDGIEVNDATWAGAGGWSGTFSSPLVHRGNIVALAENIDTSSASPSANKNTQSAIVWGIIALAIGLGIGYMVGRKPNVQA